MYVGWQTGKNVLICKVPVYVLMKCYSDGICILVVHILFYVRDKSLFPQSCRSYEYRNDVCGRDRSGICPCVNENKHKGEIELITSTKYTLSRL